VAALPVAAVAFTAVPPVRLPFSSTCTDSEQPHTHPLRYPDWHTNLLWCRLILGRQGELAEFKGCRLEPP